MIFLENCESTQDEAFKLIQNSDTPSLWVQSKQQSTGRGRQGHRWLSPEGNIYLSGAFRLPDNKNKNWPFLSLIAGTALGRSLEQINFWDQNNFFIKWPNDLFCHPKQKMGGLLTEIKQGILLVGFGINTHKAPDLHSETTQYSSKSLYEHFKTKPDNAKLVCALSKNFEDLFFSWLNEQENQSQSTIAIQKELQDKWMKNYWGLKLQEPTSSSIYRSLNLSDDAALRLENIQSKEQRLVYSGDWTLV
jgi:biotin-[acetyl-CoA-carboxylase] ligase BirA-like protein